MPLLMYTRMGALPWTLRTSGVVADQEPKVVTSESSPLPKSVKTVANEQETRRGSLDDIHHTTSLGGAPISMTNDDQAKPKTPSTAPQQHEDTTPTNDSTTTNETPNTDTDTTTALPTTEDSN